MKFVVSVVFVFASALGVARAADNGGGDLPLGGCERAKAQIYPPHCWCTSGYRTGVASCKTVSIVGGGTRCQTDGYCSIEPVPGGIFLP